jgi:lipoprotein-releasing system ATP-binding protein
MMKDVDSEVLVTMQADPVERSSLRFERESCGARLVVDELQKSYRDASGNKLEILRGISLAACGGEMVAVVGESGVGKSTLLNVLGGLDAADAGSAELDDFVITSAGEAALTRFRRREVGFVFQSHRLLPDLSAAENAALPLMIARKGRYEALHEARAMLERVGLAARASHAVGELSGGEQQRVAIARALVTRPRLVLADEPTGNLDADTGDAVSELLFALCRESQALVIVATHNMRLAEKCDRVLTLHDGIIAE